MKHILLIVALLLASHHHASAAEFKAAAAKTIITPQETMVLSGFANREVPAEGTAMELFAKTLATETLELEPGDALVFYSDGLTEAMDAELEQFGEERLMAVVERSDGMDATATRDSILEEVKRFLKGTHPQDDLTITVLRVNPATSSNGR